MKKTKPMDTPEYGPACQDYTLASGRPVKLVQPDLFDLASGKVELPNQAKLDIWHMLYRGGTDDPKEQLLSDERYARSLYYAAQLVMSPRLRLDEDDAGAVVDRRELTLINLMDAYSFLRFGPAKAPANPEQGSPDTTLPIGTGLPPGTEPVLPVDGPSGNAV